MITLISIEELKKHNILDYIEDDKERAEVAETWLKDLVEACETGKVCQKNRTYMGKFSVIYGEEDVVLGFKNLDRKYNIYEFMSLFFEDELVIMVYRSLYDNLMDKH